MYYKEVGKKLLTLALILSLTSCALLDEDLSHAKKYVEQKNYQEAIDLLKTHKSNGSKKYNAEVHMMYAEEILADLDKTKSERYAAVKPLYEEAVRLDPKNSKARTMYLMILKLIKQE